MRKVIIVLCIILALSTLSNKNNVNNSINIPKEAIRFRLIANSNEIADQALKLNIKGKLEQEIFPLIATSTSVNEARNNIQNNLEQIDNMLTKYEISYNISYGYNLFPEKSYYGVNYEAGNYESLIITIGEGVGDNWWCVLFPPLCLLEGKENDSEEVEYKSFVKEMINKYF